MCSGKFKVCCYYTVRCVNEHTIFKSVPWGYLQHSGRSKGTDPHGKQSSVISILPITTDVSLKGSVVHYMDIESRVPISKGIFNAIMFNVHTNNDSKFVGNVLCLTFVGYLGEQEQMDLVHMGIWGGIRGTTVVCSGYWLR